MHIADELVLNLFRIPNANLDIIEREQLNSIFQEMKFNMTGVVDSKTIQKLGKIHGVDALVLGSIAEMGELVRINARVADTETGKLTSVAAITVDKTEYIKELLARVINKNTTGKSSTSSSRVEKNSRSIHAESKRSFAVDTNPMALFKKIQQRANVNHLVQIQPIKKTFRIGRDYLEMTVISNKAGYVTIISVGSSGKIYQLFPNKLDTKNGIYPQRKLHIPSKSWQLPANGPAGVDHFLAVVSNTPNPFEAFSVPAGPFAKIDGNLQDIEMLIRQLKKTTDNYDDVASECVTSCDSATRDFGVVASECTKRCGSVTRDFGVTASKRTNSYGAGRMEVRELD